MNLYQVKFLKNRKIRAANGRWFTAEEPYLVHSCVQGAATSAQAVEFAKMYAAVGKKEYDEIEVKFIREN